MQRSEITRALFERDGRIMGLEFSDGLIHYESGLHHLLTYLSFQKFMPDLHNCRACGNSITRRQEISSTIEGVTHVTQSVYAFSKH